MSVAVSITSSSSVVTPAAAYVHVPFCRHRCGYCDFTLVAGRDDLIDRYLRALEREFTQCDELHAVETLFIGGGTPTHLEPAALERFFDIVLNRIRPTGLAEISIEANPDGLDADRIAVLADRGVNRVSLGMQSFDSGVLANLERSHTRADILRAVNAVRQRIDNISLDLIFGVPDQSMALWRETLHQAVDLQPTHLSTYGLTFEKGTTFWSRRQRGQLIEPDDETQREMYAASMTMLAAADFEQYEISNFARSGFRCRHNEVYWSGKPWRGFGPGAASYINGHRTTNHRSVTTWLKRIEAGESPIGDSECLAPEDHARELLALNLRRSDGIRRDEFQQLTGFVVDDLIAAPLDRCLNCGWLTDDGNTIRLTREGRFVADSIVVDFL